MTSSSHRRLTPKEEEVEVEVTLAEGEEEKLRADWRLSRGLSEKRCQIDIRSEGFAGGLITYFPMAISSSLDVCSFAAFSRSYIC